MAIFLLRHGETHANRSGLVQGQNGNLDITKEDYLKNPKKYQDLISNINKNKLNFRGFEQSIRVANFIEKENYSFKYIFVSESKRALDTVEIIKKFGNNDSEIIEDRRLIERDYGIFEGRSKEELKKSLDEGENLFTSSIESIEVVEKRVRSFYNYLIEFLENKNIDLEKDNILIITHGQIIRTFISIYYGVKNSDGILKISNVSLLKLNEKNFDLLYEDKIQIDDKIIEIKKNIRENIKNFGPSVICLLLYGPFGIENKNKKINFSWEEDLIEIIKNRFIEIFGHKDPSRLVKFFIEKVAKEKLEKRFGEYSSIFYKYINGILDALFEEKIPNLDDYSFKSYNYKDIKEIVRDALLKNEEIFNGFDEETKDDIKSKFKSKEVPFLKYYYFEEQKTIISYRFKETLSLIDKYEINYNKLLKKEFIEDEKEKKEVKNLFFGKEKFINDTIFRLVSDITSNPKLEWDNYETNFFRRFGNIAKNFLLTDIVGFKINLLDHTNENDFELRFLTAPDKIEKMIEIKFRCENHFKRLEQKRPGGIHLTYRHKEKNLPIEIQILDLKSTVYDLFGPNSHEKYVEKGKNLQ